MVSTTTKRWVQAALVYFLVAVTLGVFMAASHDFRLRGVHVHLNLLGWVSMAVSAWVYHVFPAAAQTRVAKVHFWLYQGALPPMMVALAGLLLGHAQFEPLVAASSLAVWAAVAMFVVNVLLRSFAAQAQSASTSFSARATLSRN